VQDPVFPDYSIPQRRSVAMEQYGDVMETLHDVAEQARAA
jgi:hypothetical protein